MKPINNELEKSRVKIGPMKSDATDGNNGVFFLKCPYSNRDLVAIISNQGGWEHVSVSVANKTDRIPTWEEMCFVKDLFWELEECAIQYHPPRSMYKNDHAGVLHLWRPLDLKIPMPPLAYV